MAGPVGSYCLPITIVTSLISWPGLVWMPDFMMSWPLWRILMTFLPSSWGENVMSVCPGFMLWKTNVLLVGKTISLQS